MANVLIYWRDYAAIQATTVGAGWRRLTAGNGG